MKIQRVKEIIKEELSNVLSELQVGDGPDMFTNRDYTQSVKSDLRTKEAATDENKRAEKDKAIRVYSDFIENTIQKVMDVKSLKKPMIKDGNVSRPVEFTDVKASGDKTHDKYVFPTDGTAKACLGKIVEQSGKYFKNHIIEMTDGNPDSDQVTYEITAPVGKYVLSRVGKVVKLTHPK